MADNINIGINAKGAAAAAAGMRRVGEASKGLGKDLGVLAGGVKAVQSAFAPLLAVFAAAKAIQGVSTLISSSNEAYLTQAEAVRGATDAQKEFASQLQATLGIGDEVTLGVMQQARALGIAEDKLSEATKAAIGISEATGEGLNESLKKVNRTLQGNADAFNEVIPGLSDMQSEQEKLAAINGLVTRGLEKQAEKMQGLQGIQTRASNSLGDLLEVIGQILAPMRAVVSQGIAVFAESMQSVLAPAAEFAASMMERLPPIMEQVKAGVIAAVTGIEVVLTNLPTIAEMVSAKVQLSWLQISESAQHVFTVALPAHANWFVNGFSKTLSNGLASAVQLLQNYWDKMPELFKIGFESLDLITGFFGRSFVAVLETYLKDAAGKTQAYLTFFKELFTSGFSTAAQNLQSSLASQMNETVAEYAKIAQDGVDTFGKVADNASKAAGMLFEGVEFKTGFEDLPQIAGRQITDAERELQQKLAALGADLGEQFTSKFQDRMAQIPGLLDGAVDGANLTLGELGNDKAKAGSNASELTAVQSRLLTRGRADDPNAAIADNTKATVDQLKKLNERWEQRDRQTTPEIRVVEYSA